MQSKGIMRFSLTLEDLIKRSSVVLTDSEFTSRELEELGLAEAEKLRVVYPGLHPVFYQTMDPERARDIRGLFGLEPPYLAYVGNLHPRKNLATLIDAFGILRRRGLPHRLAIIGGGGLGQMNNQEYSKLERRVEEMGLEEAITFTGYVSDENLPALFSGAEAFVFPSLYEGFGLSPLEAMACGVPVVTSRRSSIPEVVGDAAVYLDEPRDPVEIADRTEELLSSASLRDELVEKGRERVSLFTWEEAARRVLEIYREVAGSMRVAVFADQLLYKVPGGIGTYVSRLAPEVARLDGEGSYQFFHCGRPGQRLSGPAGGPRAGAHPGGARGPGAGLELPGAAAHRAPSRPLRPAPLHPAGGARLPCPHGGHRLRPLRHEVP